MIGRILRIIGYGELIVGYLGFVKLVVIKKWRGCCFEKLIDGERIIIEGFGEVNGYMWFLYWF